MRSTAWTVPATGALVYLKNFETGRGAHNAAARARA